MKPSGRTTEPAAIIDRLQELIWADCYVCERHPDGSLCAMTSFGHATIFAGIRGPLVQITMNLGRAYAELLLTRDASEEDLQAIAALITRRQQRSPEFKAALRAWLKSRLRR